MDKDSEQLCKVTDNAGAIPTNEKASAARQLVDNIKSAISHMKKGESLGLSSKDKASLSEMTRDLGFSFEDDDIQSYLQYINAESKQKKGKGG